MALGVHGWIALLSALMGVLGASLLYLASPQQQWRAAGPWPTRWRWLPGGACLVLSLALLLPLMGSGAAVFAWLTLAMLVGTAAPFLGAWRARRRQRAHRA